MRNKLLQTIRYIIIAFVCIWLAIMVIAVIMGPVVDVNNTDRLIFRLEVMWLFLVPVIGVIIKVNPKGVFSKIVTNRKKTIKQQVIYWISVVLITMVGISVINEKHTDQYKEALRQHNQETNESESLTDEDLGAIVDPIESGEGSENTDEGVLEPPSEEPALLTWGELSKNHDRYIEVMSLLGREFCNGVYSDSLNDALLNDDERELVKSLFLYYQTNGSLSSDFTESFTAFCVGEEFANMYEQPFYDSLADSFQVAWKSDNTYYIDVKVPEQPQEIESRFVGKEGITFDVSTAFDCGGVICEIYSLKIKSDSDSESPAYNYYKIFYDLTIRNERSTSISWNLAYTGNLYGLLRHRGAERKVGGNTHIKDDDFNHEKLLSRGELKAGESETGYRSLVCSPTIDYPNDTWPLYTDEKFELELHLVVDDVDYILTLPFNQ